MIRWAARLEVAVVVVVIALLAVGPRVGAFRAIVVLGPSMGHTLPLGSVVVSPPEPVAAVKVGQIISFRSPVGSHQVETHRVVRILHGGAHPVIWTKGDANATRDPWTARINGTTVWQARADMPYIGYAVRALRSPAAHLALVVGAPALWALIGLWSLWGPELPLPRRRRRPLGAHSPGRGGAVQVAGTGGTGSR